MSTEPDDAILPEQLDAIIEGLERIQELESEVARLRLTDAEREAVLAMACHCDTRSGLEWVKISATLRGLLERLK